MSDRDREDKLEYACELIQSLKERSPMRLVESALLILEFGQIKPKEFLQYLEAAGK